LKRVLIVIIIASATWLYPIKVASALNEQNVIDTQFINYQQIRERQKTNQKPVLPAKVRTSTPTPQYSGRTYSKEEVINLIHQYSNLYGIQSVTPLCIAKLESGYNQFSKNSSSTASGVFQYLNGTWASTDEGKAGYSVFDADANVKAAIKYMSSRLNTKPWVVGPKCPTVKKL